MYERILIPLDGSKIGEAALPSVEDLVSKLSPKLKVEVTLLQVVTSITHYVVAGEVAAPVPYTERELELIKHKSTEYLDKIREGLTSKGAVVKTKVSIGNAAQEILKAAEETNADMIAMSTQGRSGLRRLAFGSVTAKVIREATVPVLTVRAPKDTENT